MKRIGLHWWIILGVLVGAVGGSLLYATYIDEARREVLGPSFTRADATAQAAAVADQLRGNLRELSLYLAIDGIAQIFLELLKMIVIPLVFFSLLAGIAGMGDIGRLGRIGAKTFGLYLITSLMAIVTGLVLVNAIRPGDHAGIPIPSDAEVKPPPDSFWAVLLNMIPDNVVASAASFDLIGVIFFTLLFGIFLLMVEERKRAPMIALVDSGSEVMMRMTKFVIALAPVGIAALIARMVASTGPEIFVSMLRYVVTVIAALAIHLLITLPLLMYVITRRNPYKYLRAMIPALLTAFSTASSSGTLGVTMERAEAGAGLSNRVTSFVLPLGATVNMDGTALYEIVSVLFIAQLHAASHADYTLTFGAQLLIVFLGLMVSIGAAGIPHAGLVMMVIILEAVGLPVAYTAIIWTVDRLLDMCRTSVNVASDASVAMIVAHTENDIDETVLFAADAVEA
ncbi:MAG TPA: dicarboxylate/amino acid:cation symporter [Thermoanaerobaculia bacterium]|nr:dicarboxylate/amino acid:cation symporter [Thermoanaerobaculia bacterium]